MVVSVPEPADALFTGTARRAFSGLRPGSLPTPLEPGTGAKMEPASDGMPSDVLIVEDDPIIALDFEDTLLGFGVKTVRTAGSVARALALIDEQPPNFALLDVSLIREKSFAV